MHNPNIDDLPSSFAVDWAFRIAKRTPGAKTKSRRRLRNIAETSRYELARRNQQHRQRDVCILGVDNASKSVVYWELLREYWSSTLRGRSSCTGLTRYCGNSESSPKYCRCIYFVLDRLNLLP